MSEQTILAMHEEILDTRFTPAEVTAICRRIVDGNTCAYIYATDENYVIACDDNGDMLLFADWCTRYWVTWDSSLLPMQHLAMHYEGFAAPTSLESVASRLVGVDVPEQPLTPLQSAKLLRDVVHAMANNADVIPF